MEESVGNLQSRQAGGLIVSLTSTQAAIQRDSCQDRLKKNKQVSKAILRNLKLVVLRDLGKFEEVLLRDKHKFVVNF